MSNATQAGVVDCYWCTHMEGKFVPAVVEGRFPVDADVTEENTVVPVYALVGMCAKHLEEYELQEGVYEKQYE